MKKLATLLLICACLLLAGATASWGQIYYFTSSATASGTVGNPFSFQLLANNTPTSFTAPELPALGLYLTNPTTGLISGTPTTNGTIVVHVTAINSTLGNASGTLTITIVPVTPAPVITSSLSVNGIVGVPFSYTIVATDATS